MSQELIYTSVPRGLKPGSKGFCTVAQTADLPVQWAERLESLSGYRPVFPLGDASVSKNPVNWAHWRVNIAGRTRSVLSRVAFAGVDYSQRSNKLAHHLVLDPGEEAPGGPAWLMLQSGVMEQRWTREPAVLPKGRPIPQGDRPRRPCAAWAAATGDAGWAGMLAESFLNEPSKPAYLIFTPGTDVLPLIDEALGLLPPDKRWQVTFSTYFTEAPAGLTCAWRGVAAGTTAAKNALRQAGTAMVINLTRPLGNAEGAFAPAARTGQDPLESGQRTERLRPAPAEGRQVRSAPAYVASASTKEDPTRSRRRLAGGDEDLELVEDLPTSGDRALQQRPVVLTVSEKRGVAAWAAVVIGISCVFVGFAGGLLSAPALRFGRSNDSTGPFQRRSQDLPGDPTTSAGPSPQTPDDTSGDDENHGPSAASQAAPSQPSPTQSSLNTGSPHFDDKGTAANRADPNTPSSFTAAPTNVPVHAAVASPDGGDAASATKKPIEPKQAWHFQAESADLANSQTSLLRSNPQIISSDRRWFIDEKISSSSPLALLLPSGSATLEVGKRIFKTVSSSDGQVGLLASSDNPNSTNVLSPTVWLSLEPKQLVLHGASKCPEVLPWIGRSALKVGDSKNSHYLIFQSGTMLTLPMYVDNPEYSLEHAADFDECANYLKLKIDAPAGWDSSMPPANTDGGGAPASSVALTWHDTPFASFTISLDHDRKHLHCNWDEQCAAVTSRCAELDAAYSDSESGHPPGKISRLSKDFPECGDALKKVSDWDAMPVTNADEQKAKRDRKKSVFDDLTKAMKGQKDHYDAAKKGILNPPPFTVDVVFQNGVTQYTIHASKRAE